MLTSNQLPRRAVVWIVDDSRTEAAISERILGPSYQYEYFLDAASLLARLANDPRHPDLLLIDWVMPGMPGDEVCRAIRSRAETADLPIIMMTASHDESTDVSSALASGANDYIRRPFVAGELEARVGAVLRTKFAHDDVMHERSRLRMINELGRFLLDVRATAVEILEHVARNLASGICDGCSILILPGPLPPVAVSRHRYDPTGNALAAISTVADPIVHAFASDADAAAQLPPAYRPYIQQFGLRGLGILPFPIRDPVRGIVTVTRDGRSQPFDADDIQTIQTCIEYAALACERALQQEAERVDRAQLDAVLQHLPLGVLVTDVESKLSLVNAAARELLPGSVAASTLREVFDLASWTTPEGTPFVASDWIPDDAVPALAAMAELRLQLPSEREPRAITLSRVPLRDRHDSLCGTVTILQDVSAERAITAERDRMSRFQQEMLGVVGHDLRNPLAAVLAGSELLAAQSPPNLQPIITRVQSSVRRMTRIIDQLLDVTRARLGTGIPIAPYEIDLLPLVRGVVEELVLAYPKQQIQLREVVPVRGHWDPDRLGQVVSNLISNAAQYGDPAKPITVDVQHLDGNATVTITNAVRDRPIPPDQLAAIFTPFRRGTSKSNVGGLGLGLYIVYEIVRAHGGTIDVESSLANGTSFRVRLPSRSLRTPTPVPLPTA